MTLATDLAALDLWIGHLPRVALAALGDTPAPLFVLDFIMVGAVKRSMSLAAGMKSMVESKNMVCARALLRLQIDTLTRLRAYTYVEDPEALAKSILAGSQLNEHKSTDGKQLRDSYLVDRLAVELPWLPKTYRETSGYVHFSEKQFFDAVVSIGGEMDRTLNLTVSATDEKYPVESWIEVVACFNDLTHVLSQTVEAYAAHKNAA